MTIVFVLITVLSFMLVYGTNVAARMNMEMSAQRLGDPQCDPLEPAADDTSSGPPPYQCFVPNVTGFTKTYLEDNATKEEKACYCSVVGYAVVFADDDLLHNHCKDWLIQLGSAIGLAGLTTVCIVGINVICKIVLLKLAEWENPLSESALDSSKMTKIWALQSLNTGAVIFLVNFAPPDIPLLKGLPIFQGEFNDPVRGWYAIVGAALLTNMAANAVTPAATNVVMMIVNSLMRCCFGRRQKHQAQLNAYYTNPPFDIAARYAQLLTTVYVTLAYSAGLPMLNFCAAAYMFFTYWADKLVLLRGSVRPPAYDTTIPKEASQYMLYAVALHCVGAIWMFGQRCTFPSNPLGGALSSLASEAGSAASGEAVSQSGLYSKITLESTWMMFLLLVVLTALWALWTVLWILGGTFGSLFQCIGHMCCPSGWETQDASADVPWSEACKEIEAVYPPASYKMERHPNFREVSPFMKTMQDSSKSWELQGIVPVMSGAPKGADSDGSEPGNAETEPGSPPKKAWSTPTGKMPVTQTVAESFLEALRKEYVEGVAGAVGTFFEESQVLAEDQDALDSFEETVRNARDSADEDAAQAIDNIRRKWGLPAPV